MREKLRLGRAAGIISRPATPAAKHGQTTKQERRRSWFGHEVGQCHIVSIAAQIADLKLMDVIHEERISFLERRSVEAEPAQSENSVGTGVVQHHREDITNGRLEC